MKREQCEEDRFVYPIDEFNEQSSSKNETHPAGTGRLSYSALQMGTESEEAAGKNGSLMGGQRRTVLQ